MKSKILFVALALILSAGVTAKAQEKARTEKHEQTQLQTQTHDQAQIQKQEKDNAKAGTQVKNQEKVKDQKQGTTRVKTQRQAENHGQVVSETAKGTTSEAGKGEIVKQQAQSKGTVQKTQNHSKETARVSTAKAGQKTARLNTKSPKVTATGRK
ncbi:MAG TPA: hypothetical protein PLR88_07930 [Bacteroidales bacterium]|nr:hypothetical protein [Bacteroidales bacterium]HPT21858.1 hypothetical protein [Bacteroidales bacterium]